MWCSYCSDCIFHACLMDDGAFCPRLKIPFFVCLACLWWERMLNTCSSESRERLFLFRGCSDCQTYFAHQALSYFLDSQIENAGPLKGTENCTEKNVQIHDVTSIMVSKSELYSATPWLHNFYFLHQCSQTLCTLLKYTGLDWGVKPREPHKIFHRCIKKKKKTRMATGPVSWSLTHPTVFWATISPAYLQREALCPAVLFVVTGTDDSLWSWSSNISAKKQGHSLTFWLWSQTPCTTRVCMADKDPLTAKWIIAPRTL